MEKGKNFQITHILLTEITFLSIGLSLLLITRLGQSDYATTVNRYYKIISKYCDAVYIL